MAYKDKDKQREANAERQRRYKAKHKGVTSEGVTDKALPVMPDPEFIEDILKLKGTAMGITTEPLDMKPKRGKDKQGVTGVCCIDHSHNFTGKMTVMERLFYRPASQLGRGETNFVSLPGRACYGVV